MAWKQAASTEKTNPFCLGKGMAKQSLLIYASTAAAAAPGVVITAAASPGAVITAAASIRA